MLTFRMWSGPISASVFVHEAEMDTARIYIEYLRKCDRRMKDQVTFHFMFPYEKAPLMNLTKRMSMIHNDDMSTNTSLNELLVSLTTDDLCLDTTQLLKKIFAYIVKRMYR